MPPTSRPPTSPPGLERAARLVLLACAALLGGCAEQREPPTLVYARTARDLLADPPEFEVLQANPRVAHSIEVLTPSTQYGQDGAGLMSLVMPPPGELRFSVGDFEGRRILRLRAGADISAARFLRGKAELGAFTFEVLVNGEPAAQTRRVVRREYPAGRPGTEWTDLGGAAGVRVAPGDVITLRTNVLGDDGQPFPAPYGPRIGFGGLRLEEVVRRPRAPATPQTPNLVLVVVDTLRRDRLSTYGYERPTSPSLDGLAARGTVFDAAYSTAPWTWPSTASLLTGLQPREHGIRSSRSCFLAEELTTLAEVCQDAGLATVGWSGNPLISPRLNFDQGFGRLTAPRNGFEDTGTFFEQVEAWVGQQGDGRFFLYLHLVEPHHPYRPLPLGAKLFAASWDDTDGRLSNGVHLRVRDNNLLDERALPLDELLTQEERDGVSDLYDACVWSADHWLGRLLGTLERLGLEDRTVVAFTSDHGEELLERGYLGHGRTLHDELVHVPLVLAGPGVPAGRRLAEPVSNRRLAAYLAGRAGSAALGPPDLLAADGAAPVLFSTEVGAWDYERNASILGMRAGSSVVHYAELPDDPETFDPARLRVFDLGEDPGEQVDLTPADAEAAQRLWADLRGRFEALGLVRGERRDDSAEETLRLLERIGYIGR